MPNVLEMASYLQSQTSSSESAMNFEQIQHYGYSIYDDLKVCMEAFKNAWGEKQQKIDKLAEQQNQQEKVCELYQNGYRKERDKFDEETWSLYLSLIKEGADLEEFEKFVEFFRYGIPDHTDFEKNAKFQEDFKSNFKTLSSFLHAPELSKENKSKDCRQLLEQDRVACQKAWEAFYPFYEKERKGRKKFDEDGFSNELKKVSEDFLKACKNLSKTAKFIVQCAKYIPEMRVLLDLVRTSDLYDYSFEDVEERVKDGGVEFLGEFSGGRLFNPYYASMNMEKLPDLKKAIALIKNVSTEIQEAKSKIEQDIAQIEPVLERYKSEKVKRGLDHFIEDPQDDWETKREKKKAFEEKQKALAKEMCAPLVEIYPRLWANLKALFLAVSAHYGVDRVFQASHYLGDDTIYRGSASVIYNAYTKDHSVSNFKAKLEEKVLKPLEEQYLAKNMAIDLNLVKDALCSDLSTRLQPIQEAFINYQQSYKQLQEEGIVTEELEKEEKEYRGILDQAKRDIRFILETLHSCSENKDIAQIAQEALEELLEKKEEFWMFSFFKRVVERDGMDTTYIVGSNREGRKEILSLLEKILADRAKNPKNSNLSKEGQILSYANFKHKQEKQRLDGDQEAGPLPLWYYKGDNLTAYEDYLKASQQDNAEAYLELGKMAKEGIVLPQSFLLAHSYFKKAIELGSIRALSHLGFLYLDLVEGVIDGDKEKIAAQIGVSTTEKDFKNEMIKHARVYFDNAHRLQDGCANTGLERIDHIEEDDGNWFIWEGAEDYSTDIETLDKEAVVREDEIVGECIYKHVRHQDCDYDDVEYIVGNNIGKFYSGKGFYAKMDGVNARMALSYLQLIYELRDEDTKKEEQQEAYEDAKEEYEEGMELGSGRCALELGELRNSFWNGGSGRYEPFDGACYKLSTSERDAKTLEYNHTTLACFKRAVELRFNKAIKPLIKLLEEQQELLEKLSKHPSHAILSTQYQADLKEAKAFELAIKEAEAEDFKQIKPVTFMPNFAKNADFIAPKQKAKKEEKKVKPLWQYGRNTKQAFKDYMEAKDKNNSSAWIELGKMSLLGVVVPPDPVGAAVCFKKAQELGNLQSYYGASLSCVVLEKLGYDSPNCLVIEKEGFNPNYETPLKSTELKEDQCLIFPINKPADGTIMGEEIEDDDVGDALNNWMPPNSNELEESVFEQGECRGMWYQYGNRIRAFWNKTNYEEVIEAIEKAIKKSQESDMQAWYGLLRISAGLDYEQLKKVYGVEHIYYNADKNMSDVIGLSHTYHYVKARDGGEEDYKNLAHDAANEGYSSLAKSIANGFVDGYWFLGTDGFVQDWLVGFYRALELVRAKTIERYGTDDYEGVEIYSGEIEYEEGLVPEISDDLGKEFYEEKRKQALLKGAEAGSAMCAAEAYEWIGEELDGEFAQRNAQIAFLTPFFEEQGSFRVLDKLLEVLKEQIDLYEERGEMG
ncbi:tetratricopeptide repeat protein [Helicobacter suis]|uniref:tetratricopeptide repeat protein n=1 Tax=Helicobacter suis TaxID=104628 RepID=UPI0013D6BB34|nr:sel1 repeat family protein [Helicobacter suis]